MPARRRVPADLSQTDFDMEERANHSPAETQRQDPAVGRCLRRMFGAAVDCSAKTVVPGPPRVLADRPKPGQGFPTHPGAAMLKSPSQPACAAREHGPLSVWIVLFPSRPDFIFLRVPMTASSDWATRRARAAGKRPSGANANYAVAGMARSRPCLAQWR
ncbi:hypothetical protein BDY21DRAFT_333303 [Lineolata rhizophorae]|uniref:Uncharacterized protein n=1 Tax=Lineolata rhizophorae TaxID=578093 RepID=A0A6A6PBG0_9PEZI|nr:hypothetical protein BDY21DRAFT_333303 [Lineolata rhizophorae]